MIAVSDTGPLNYMILVDAQDALGHIVDQVILPLEVATELNHPKAPAKVSTWLNTHPAWLTIAPSVSSKAAFQHDNAGGLQLADIACIDLAQSYPGSVLLVDDRLAKEEATARSVRTSGTLAFLFAAGEAGFLDFADALTKLERTTFRVSATLRAHYRQRWENLKKANS